jgi:hypothetical protein
MNKVIASQKNLPGRYVSLMVLTAAFLFISVPAQAADLSKAKGTVNNIRQADPPQVSTGTKQNMSGTPASEFRPKPPSMKTKQPPSPVNRNNPKNDPDVQKGFNKHQKQHGK